MSGITVELSELDADLWEAFKRGGAWVAHSEYMRVVDDNAKLRTFIDLKETCWKYVGWCDECPYNGADDERDDFNCTVQEKINLLARELGIEVNDGTK